MYTHVNETYSSSNNNNNNKFIKLQLYSEISAGAISIINADIEHGLWYSGRLKGDCDARDIPTYTYKHNAPITWPTALWVMRAGM